MGEDIAFRKSLHLKIYKLFREAIRGQRRSGEGGGDLQYPKRGEKRGDKIDKGGR